MNYFIKKEERAKKAQEHTELMEKEYKEEIAKSSKKSKIYSSEIYLEGKKEKETEIILEEIDSVSAIFKYAEDLKKIAVLNFASYKNPGGMFLKGSSAQEESLCHESFLYNVLSKQQNFYNWNRSHLNKSLYLNRAIYSPNIVFQRESENVHCDVITCAAPNFNAFSKKYLNINDSEIFEDNDNELKNRIRFILDIAADNNVDILILGAFGCGVFKQNPEKVARYFKESLEQRPYFEKVIFAIIGNSNMEIFQKIFFK